MMRVLVRTKRLLPVLLLGLAVLAIRLPTTTSDPVLADGPPTADKLQEQVEDTEPLAYPALAELVAEESATPEPPAQLDDSTHGTY